jgi:NADH:ubiquinone oxidoreductase subunit
MFFALQITLTLQVPAEWHGWLHRMTDKAPPTHAAELKKPFFAQEHAKNPTGQGAAG